MRHSARIREAGLTMIELLVAMVLALLVTAAVLRIYQGVSQNYRYQEGMSRLQENGRLAHHFLARTVRLSGYRVDASRSLEDTYPADTSMGAAVGEVVSGFDNSSGAAGIKDGTDGITVRFQGNGDGTISDCLGSGVGTGVTRVTTFTVAPDNTLQCATDLDGDTLIRGVENMQIEYGVDTDADRSANNWQSAAEVTLGSDWANVVSVRMALLLSTVDGVSNQSDPVIHTLLSTTVSPPAATDPGRRLRRKVFTGTINLRNVAP